MPDSHKNHEFPRNDRGEILDTAEMPIGVTAMSLYMGHKREEKVREKALKKGNHEESNAAHESSKATQWDAREHYLANRAAYEQTALEDAQAHGKEISFGQTHAAPHPAADRHEAVHPPQPHYVLSNESRN